MNKPMSRRIFTEDEWKCSNYAKFNLANQQSCEAETLLAETCRLKEEINHQTKKCQEEVKSSLEKRTKQLNFCISELQLKVSELDDHTTRQQLIGNRLKKGIDHLQKPLCCAKKCHDIREKREGMERVYDRPARELLKEVETLQEILQSFEDASQQSDEQVRLLKKAKYQISRDIQDKQSALDIDRNMIDLGVKSPGLDLVCGDVILNTDGPTVESWQQHVDTLLQMASKQIQSSYRLQANLNQLMAKCYSDASSQIESTNLALSNRIDEIRNAKTILEDKLSMVQQHVVAMERSCEESERAIADLREPLSRAQLRLQGRTGRPCGELTSDPAQRRLLLEVQQVQRNADRLRQQLTAAQTQLRKLDREKLVLCEDIAKKTSTLQQCEGECMSHRQSVRIPEF